MSEENEKEKLDKAIKAWEKYILTIVTNLSKTKQGLQREIKAIDEYIETLLEQIKTAKGE